MKTSLFRLAACAAALACAPAQAASLYEGFSYSDGQDVTTVASTATNLGNWTSTTAGIVGTTNSAGLTFANLSTSGGSLAVTKPTGGGWQFLAAPVGAGGAVPNGSTLYASYLYKFVGPGGAVGAPRNFGVSVGDNTGADHTFQLLSHSYNRNPNQGRIGYTDAAADWSQLATGNIFDGSTYLFVGKWTGLGGASQANGWLLSAANFSAISGDGIVTEAELSANNIATNTASKATAGSFGTAQFVKIGDFIDDATLNYQVDEIRFSDSLAGALPVVPEPNSVVLLACGLGVALVRRRS